MGLISLKITTEAATEEFGRKTAQLLDDETAAYIDAEGCTIVIEKVRQIGAKSYEITQEPGSILVEEKMAEIPSIEMLKQMTALDLLRMKVAKKVPAAVASAKIAATTLTTAWGGALSTLMILTHIA